MSRRWAAAAGALLAFVACAPRAQETGFAGFTMLEVERLEVTRAASVLAIVDGFVPAIEKALATRLLAIEATGDGAAVLVDVATRGYLDDSIAGENFRARIVPAGDGWRLTALGRQVVCRRGPRAGQPAEICP